MIRRLIGGSVLIYLLVLQSAAAFQSFSSVLHQQLPSSKSIARSSLCRPLLASSSSIPELVKGIQSGSTKIVDVVEDTLRRIEDQDEAVGAFLAINGDKALIAAQALDTKIASGDQATKRLPLLGLPIAIKDNICTAGIATTASSKVLDGYVPSYDATSVAKLRAAGAIIIGKTNMDEFGMGSTTETSGYHITRNPHDLSRSPGGSSGGSAAAVAAGMVTAALGTDTGGSIRQPASWTGVVGLKPSYGRVSRYGLLAYGSSTDVIGPLTNSVTDAAYILSAMAGTDPTHDATTNIAPPVPDYLSGLAKIEKEMLEGGGKPLAGLKVGLIKETLESRVENAVTSTVREAVDMLSNLGAEIIEVSIPYLDQHCASYYVNVLSEASANLARYDGVRYGLRTKESASAKSVMLDSRGIGFGEEVKQRILLGTFSLSAGYSDAYYLKSQQLRSILSKSFADSFQAADVLVCPTSPTVAYPLGRTEESKVDMYADDLFTVPASLAGLPAISLPARVADKSLPIGLQIIGKRFAEDKVLEVARAFELAYSQI